MVAETPTVTRLQRYICPLYDNLSTQKQSSRAIISFYQGKQEVLKFFSSIKYICFERMADNKGVTVGRPRRRCAFYCQFGIHLQSVLALFVEC